MPEKIIRKKVSFEILKVRIIKGPDEKEIAEIEVKVTDEQGTRKQVVQEGDVLVAQFDQKERE
jgi:hypothetical protein